MAYAQAPVKMTKCVRLAVHLGMGDREEEPEARRRVEVHVLGVVKEV